MIVRSRMWMSKKKISKKVFKLCICWFQSATLWFFLSLIRICIWDSKNYLGTFLNDKCRLININRVILLNCTACNCLFKYLCIHLYFFVDSNYFIKKETLNITKFMGFFFSLRYDWKFIFRTNVCLPWCVLIFWWWIQFDFWWRQFLKFSSSAEFIARVFKQVIRILSCSVVVNLVIKPVTMIDYRFRCQHQLDFPNRVD